MEGIWEPEYDTFLLQCKSATFSSPSLPRTVKEVATSSNEFRSKLFRRMIYCIKNVWNQNPEIQVIRAVKL